MGLPQWTTVPWADRAASGYDTMLKIHHSLYSMINETRNVMHMQVGEIISIL
jgi:hypothetical protein